MTSDNAREAANTLPIPSAYVEGHAGHFAHSSPSSSEALGRPSARPAATPAGSLQSQPAGSPESPRPPLRRSKANAERSEHFFTPWLICDHPAVQALASDAIAEAERAELLSGKRSRRRSDKARLAFNALAQAVIANAAYALAEDPRRPTVALPLGNSATRRPNRYQKLHLGQIRPVLAALGAGYGPRRKGPSLITLSRSRQYGIASIIRPGRQLQDCCTAAPDFGLHSFHEEGGETISVHRVERSDYAYKRKVVLVDYEDTDETIRMRVELERINAWVRQADLSFVGGEASINRKTATTPPHLQHPQRRAALRSARRLHGGWWQNS